MYTPIRRRRTPQPITTVSEKPIKPDPEEIIPPQPPEPILKRDMQADDEMPDIKQARTPETKQKPKRTPKKIIESTSGVDEASLKPKLKKDGTESKPRGRPRKYANDEERKEAIRRQKREWYHKNKARKAAATTASHSSDKEVDRESDKGVSGLIKCVTEHL